MIVTKVLIQTFEVTKYANICCIVDNYTVNNGGSMVSAWTFIVSISLIIDHFFILFQNYYKFLSVELADGYVKNVAQNLVRYNILGHFFQ